MQKKWMFYIIVGDIEVCIKRELSTLEAIKWISENCETKNDSYFLCETEMFCKCYYERQAKANEK